MQLSGTIFASLLAVAQAFPHLERSAFERFPVKNLDFEIEKFDDAISPKAVVVLPFAPAASVWHKHYNFTESIVVPGLSPLYPEVYCTKDYDVCNFITGEGEANAASSVTAFLASPYFNLTETYFLVGGISEINPTYGTVGSTAFARYTVSLDVQRHILNKSPIYSGNSTAATNATKFAESFLPAFDVYEVNANLRDRAALLASKVKLNDSKALNATRSHYNSTAAIRAPRVLKCDSAVPFVYYTDLEFDEFASNSTKAVTNGTGKYCTTAGDQPAILEAALRNAKFGLTDFSRWVLLSAASDFDSLNQEDLPSNAGIAGIKVAAENLYRAGYPFIKDVVKNWNSTYHNGTVVANATRLVLPVGQVNTTDPKIVITNYTLLNSTNGTNSTNTTGGRNGTYAPTNYIGDAYGTLGGVPDFGGANFTSGNVTSA